MHVYPAMSSQRHKPGRHWHKLTSYPASARMKPRLLLGALVTKAAELYSTPCCRKTTGLPALEHLTCQHDRMENIHACTCVCASLPGCKADKCCCRSCACTLWSVQAGLLCDVLSWLQGYKFRHGRPHALHHQPLICMKHTTIANRIGVPVAWCHRHTGDPLSSGKGHAVDS